MTSGNYVPIFILPLKVVTVVGNIGQVGAGLVTLEGEESGEIESAWGQGIHAIHPQL